jgi:RNA polymerase sigma-70 factor (ECF subfamily)
LNHEGEDIEDIIQGCKKGNRQAQERLYRNYYRSMMNLCLRYTRNEADAMEILNTGFYKVLKHIAAYKKEKASLYTWIRAIIINSCIDSVKKKDDIFPAGEMQQAAHIHVPPSVVSHMSATEILQWVRTLPPATQMVFNLYVVEGFNHNEIGAMMDISPGTSKWHLSEARKKLQIMINEAQKTG